MSSPSLLMSHPNLAEAGGAFPIVRRQSSSFGYGADRLEPILVDVNHPKWHYDTSLFVHPACYEDDVEYVMIPKGMLVDRIEKLAKDIRECYGYGEPIHVVCVLKSSRGFFSYLLKFLGKQATYMSDCNKPPYIEHYVSVKRTQDPQHDSPTNVHYQVLADNMSVVANQHVIIVDDMIDSGKTVSYLCKYMSQYNPKSIKVAALLEKRVEFPKFKADFVGFSIPNVFVGGFCIDYREMFRDLEHLCVIGNEAVERYNNKHTPL